jgi:hypothetical protein
MPMRRLGHALMPQRLTTTPMLPFERKASPSCIGRAIVVNGEGSSTYSDLSPLPAVLALVFAHFRRCGSTTAVGLGSSRCLACPWRFSTRRVAKKSLDRLEHCQRRGVVRRSGSVRSWRERRFDRVRSIPRRRSGSWRAPVESRSRTCGSIVGFGGGEFGVRPIAWRRSTRAQRQLLRLAPPFARIHFPSMPFERCALFGSCRSTHGDRTDCRPVDRARIGSRADACVFARLQRFRVGGPPLPSLRFSGSGIARPSTTNFAKQPRLLADARDDGAAALVFWAAVFRASAPIAFLILFVTGVQMSLLGALLTFAAVPLFSVHEFTTAAWGLTPLEDQRLGGLLMWVPAGLLLTAYSVFAFAAALRLDGSLAPPAKEKAA